MASEGLKRFLVTTLLLSLMFGELLAIAAMLDLGSYLATGPEEHPHDNPKGAALIVYDPGLTGAGRRAATWMAADLQNMRYNVTVAGVRSPDAMNASGRDVVIFIGPTLAGKPPGPMAYCLGNVTVDPGTTVGIFGIRGLLGDKACPAMRDILQARGITVTALGNVGPLDRDIEQQSYAFVIRLLS
ncbi:MAG: hypothetical protein WBZ29_03375 [Methanocella sp.]